MQEQHGHNGQHHAKRKRNPGTCGEAGHQVTHEAHHHYGSSIRQLRCHVTQVVALRTRRRQDGRVGNRRDMVAIHRAAESRTDGNQEQRVARVKHTDYDGQDESNGAPARTHRKADECRNQENGERQQSKTNA